MNASTPLKLSQVPAFLQEHYGWKVTRQSVYNWVKVGLRNAKLQVSPSGYKSPATTTPDQLRMFFEQAGIDLSVGRV